MKKILVALLLLGVLMYALYRWAFARSEYVYARLPQVKVGMRPQQVRAILGAPDTVFAWNRGEPDPWVMQYHMGFGAPDDVRVFFAHDTVTAATYNQ